MLSAMTVDRKATRIRAHTTTSKIYIQQQQAKSMQVDREKIALRQRLSEKAHIKRFREKITYQDKAAYIRTQLPDRWTAGDKKQVAARITIASNKAWQKGPVTVVHEDTDPTASHASSRGESSPEPDNEKRSNNPETDQSSHHGSDDGKKARKLSKILMMLDGEYVKLQNEFHSAKQQLSENDARYQALEQKYAEQRGQRIKDKKLVDSYAKEVANIDAYCEEIEGAKRVLEDCLIDAKEKHQTEISAKDREIETLKANHEIAITAKDVETEKWHEACLQKDSRFQKTVTKLIFERDETRLKANSEKRKIWETSRIKTDDIKAKLEALRTEYDRMAADSDDAISKNEETIIGLVARNQQLELEHGAMSRMLEKKYGQGTELHQLHRVIEASSTSKEEAKELQTTVRRLEEQNENLLDTLQNIEKDCTRHREAEMNMRCVLNRAHNTKHVLEDKLALSRIQLRNTAKQLEQVQQGAVLAGAHCAALDAVEQENEDLRDSLQAERNEKVEMQAKLDKLDSENLGLSIEYDSIDAELLEHRMSSSMLRESTEASMQELRILRKVVQDQQGVLGDQVHRDLLALVSKINEENNGLVESTARMETKLQKMEQYGATIEDKSESEVMKAKHSSDYWFHLYYNEAVTATERLHAEIAALKAEKGEQHFVEPTPPANPVVFDRKMLPYATMYGLAGVPAHLITSTVYNAEGGTGLSATAEALQTLRPQGWYPIVVAGKVWLSKTVKPFSEEEAARQIQVGGHIASVSGAVSGQSSMSNTYAPRNPHPLSTCNVYRGLPEDYSELPTPFLAHTSSKRVHNPIPSERSNQVAARREATRPTTKQTPKLKPQAACRAAQTPTIQAPRAPEYQSSWLQIDDRMTREVWEDLDDDLKINWVRLNVKTKSD